MTLRKTVLVLVALIALVALSYACGDDDNGGESPAATSPAGSGGGGGGGEQKKETFDVSMKDNVFEPAQFAASGGAIAVFNITNGGIAIHNMRIAGADGEYNTEDDAVSDPALVNGGERAVAQWVAKDTGGAFDFRCDFHPETMVGTITVEPSGDIPDAGQEGP